MCGGNVVDLNSYRWLYILYISFILEKNLMGLLLNNYQKIIDKND